ncbi:MAG: site-2 protease family protein [Chloroflexi bacterium]|nr:site-2 protease family protein [Chloroflexota bacterium]
MNARPPFARNLRLGRDQIFWLVAGLVLLVYALVVLDPLSLGATLIGLVLAITVHECAHAFTADRLGDPTGRWQGRVTLNPLAHLDPLGSLMMLVTALTGMGIGWGKPVPVNTYRLRYGPYRGHALVSLSGPLANLLLAALIGLPMRLFGITHGWAHTLLSTLAWVNIVIALFNLLPIPPLDGFGVLIGLISLVRASWASSAISWLLGLQRYGTLILIGVLILPQVVGLSLIGSLVGPLARWLYQAFTSPLGAGLLG